MLAPRWAYGLGDARLARACTHQHISTAQAPSAVPTRAVTRRLAAHIGLSRACRGCCLELMRAHGSGYWSVDAGYREAAACFRRRCRSWRAGVADFLLALPAVTVVCFGLRVSQMVVGRAVRRDRFSTIKKRCRNCVLMCSGCSQTAWRDGEQRGDRAGCVSTSAVWPTHLLKHTPRTRAAAPCLHPRPRSALVLNHFKFQPSLGLLRVRGHNMIGSSRRSSQALSRDSADGPRGTPQGLD